MIDKDKNYVGKIIKVNFSYNGHQKEETGIVLKQTNTPSKFSLSLILLNGETRELDSRRFQFNKISSVRLEKDVRDALVALYRAMDAQATFLANFWKTKNELENNVRKAQSQLNSQTGIMSVSEFRSEIESLFSERFPSSTTFPKRLYFSVDSVNEKTFLVSHNQELTKYAVPEQYPFLYREYDNSIQIDYDFPSLKTFCEKNAPAEIPALKGQGDHSLDAFLGDKGILCVRRSYELPLKYGVTRKSIDFIENSFLAPDNTKASLDSIIGSAKRKQSKTASKAAVKNKDRELE